MMAWHDGTNRQAGSDCDPFIVIIHGNRFPRAVLDAKRTADATIQVYFDDFQQIRMLRSRHYLDAIRRAHDNARLTPRTSVLIDHRELPRFTLSNRLLRHTHAFMIPPLAHSPTGECI